MQKEDETGQENVMEKGAEKAHEKESKKGVLPDIRKDMPKSVRNDILYTIKKAQRLINKQDAKQLKELSDYTLHNASIFQDEDSLTIAVVIYALSKLLERWGYDTEYADQARNFLGSAQFSLEGLRMDEYHDKVKKLLEFIAAVDKQFRLYVDKAIEKARVKKGSRLHEYGISIARAAQLLETGRWELMSYVGKTRIHDEEDMLTGVVQRLDFARSLFARPHGPDVSGAEVPK
ncbi:hypothetical protein KY362_03495 [Candidatus Woesearchaeota archaeon]|nr:hypothetical protein [Candidatus Woesearchaeota archaeon]